MEFPGKGIHCGPAATLVTEERGREGGRPNVLRCGRQANTSSALIAKVSDSEIRRKKGWSGRGWKSEKLLTAAAAIFRFLSRLALKKEE